MADAAKQDTYLRVKGFRVEISGGSDGKSSDTNWFRVSGGADVIETIESTVGNETYNTFTPGHSYVTPLVLEGGMTPTREGMLKWIDDQMKGKDFRRMVTVIPFNVEGKEQKAHEYHDCFVEEYTFPDLDAELHDTLTERIVIRSLRHDVKG
jgi:phage tail-like protein